MIASVKAFLFEHKKIALLLFFTGGFTWDSLTLGSIDGWYSNVVLFTYLCCLTVTIYIFNRTDDNAWNGTTIEPYVEYAPYAIQFFLGGLCSAYVIFFFQSVSLTKTMVFFLLLVVLLFSNEILRNRISNKYLQFSAYYFVNFTFFTFFIPILVGAMNTFWFIISGLLSIVSTLYLIFFIYYRSPSTRKEIKKIRISSLILGIYVFINTCYYFNLIPPVPLSLQEGIVAHRVQKQEGNFIVTYEKAPIHLFWKSFDNTFELGPGDTVFVYTSIFAPTNLEKEIFHHWQWFNQQRESWQTSDSISINVLGGRRGGFRGYTFKENVSPGYWKVDVITKEGLVLGLLKFNIREDSTHFRERITTRLFK
ncbi:DUF2914 domain-containing protein [Balneolaceae bacterium YR4-1]|uniref:DUF2914 domain-containing protein n=1 Tax=Halalkalibaculum roseum TaxID=2709311 RepID=A0A6M1SS35_9BACT|nr:DUF2914 domain-containing protein [Halalkalibaculum roseum]NGP75640.1 DUF2914 domain-containing protein [Halalkalibaculum roseum]